MNFPHYFSEKRELLNQYLDEVLVCKDEDTRILMEACRYSALNGGKRIRGVITLTIAQLIGDDVRKYLPLAAGIELIHTYSLIHDDLPAMDDDDVRRGQPSCHKKYGEDIAILAGDYLLTYAYSLFSEQLMKEGFLPENIIVTIAYISRCLGINGMVGGQVIDIKSTGKEIALAQLEHMHDLKTGKFIETSFLSPVLLNNGNVNFKKEFSLRYYSKGLGLLFQIVDDIIDETGNEVKMGKPKGADRALNKSTYVSLLGLEGTQKRADELYLKLVNMLSILDNKEAKDQLGFFLEFIYKRDY